jgi:histidine triad (HIT) family protein
VSTGQPLPTLFERIIRREVPATFVHEDDQCVAIRDIGPKAPTHVLVIPRKPLAGVQAATAQDQALLGHLLLVARQIAEREGIAASGYRLVINAGPDAGQAVPHLHVHVLGGRALGWPPG